MSDSEFARLCAKHPVQRWARGYKYLTHPEHGEIDLKYQVVHAPEDDGRRILIHTLIPDTRSSEVLTRIQNENRSSPENP